MKKMCSFERDYIELLRNIMDTGEERRGRNGITKSVFGKTLVVDMSDGTGFPLLVGRKMFYKGVFGEMAAFLRGPKNIKDFEEMGCNYWKQWQDNDEGDITIDYGNLWKDFGGVSQLDNLRDSLKYNPTDRRMLISGWNPPNLDNNSLPCCHLLYQWYVRDGRYLDMVWYQRSVDSMVGLPSDIILAAVWNILLANECGYEPGRITMNLGDTHIYEEHFHQVQTYINGYMRASKEYPQWTLMMNPGEPIEHFHPERLVISNYKPSPAMKLEVVA